MAPTRKYTDEQMLAAVRAAAEASGGDRPLTAAGYDRHHARSGGPSGPAVINRFGTWRGALQAAGLAANQASGHASHWTEQELVGWVARYLADPSTNGSYQGYLAWVRGVAGAPSGATIRNRSGGWSAACAAARATALGRSD